MRQIYSKFKDPPIIIKLNYKRDEPAVANKMNKNYLRITFKILIAKKTTNSFLSLHITNNLEFHHIKINPIALYRQCLYHLDL